MLTPAYLYAPNSSTQLKPSAAPPTVAGTMSRLRSENEKLRRAATAASRKIKPRKVRMRTISALESDIFATSRPFVPNIIIAAMNNMRFFERSIGISPK